MVPFNADRLELVTSFKINVALVVKLVLPFIAPPSCDTPSVKLLLIITPSVPTLKSMNLLWERPLELGFTILTIGTAFCALSTYALCAASTPVSTVIPSLA